MSLKMQPSRNRDLFLLIVWVAAFGALFYLYDAKGHNYGPESHNKLWLSLLVSYVITSFWFGYVTCARIGLRPRRFVIGIGNDLAAFVMIIYLTLWLACAVIWGWVGLASTPIEMALCIRRLAARRHQTEPPPPPVALENNWAYFQANAPQDRQPWGSNASNRPARPARPASHRRK